jgi:phosphatidylserine decarboxylase
MKIHKIHKEGYNIILILFFALAAINGVHYFYASHLTSFFLVLIASLILFFMVINFFKNPTIYFQEETKDIVIAPADGVVVVIEPVFEPEYFKDQRLQVSIFMGITNVHVNWIPVDGKVIHSSHQDGRFFAAYLPKSSTDNERSTVVIERANGERVMVRQIAGAMARRIVTYAKEGTPCHINEQLGFIKFGSRVDVFLPMNTRIDVELNERVYGNQTIIADFTAERSAADA